MSRALAISIMQAISSQHQINNKEDEASSDADEVEAFEQMRKLVVAFDPYEETQTAMGHDCMLFNK
jgi:hypothetical protein